MNTRSLWTSEPSSNHDHISKSSKNKCLMEDNDNKTFSSSSSSYKLQYHQNPSPSTPPNLTLEIEFSSSSLLSGWATRILLEAAKAISNKNTTRVHQLTWMLNELGSPYGDTDQKLASYFAHALFCRITNSGKQNHLMLTSASEKNRSFDSMRRTMLKFQDASPWTTFGHVACNGAIIEALYGEEKIHIIDIGNTYCTQWPTFIEAIATRRDEPPPHLRLTSVVAAAGGGSGSGATQKVMKEIGNRMEKFARLMGVRFRFNLICCNGDLSEFDWGKVEINYDEALAINCNGSLRSVSPIGGRREDLISIFRQLEPRIVTVVEEEGDFDIGFEEWLRFYKVYFEMLSESFSATSNERLMLERAAGRAVVDVVACQPAESIERRESATRWSLKFSASSFCGVPFSDEVSDNVRALLRRYKEGWTTVQFSDSMDTAGIFLAWKDQPVVWASAWKP